MPSSAMSVVLVFLTVGSDPFADFLTTTESSFPDSGKLSAMLFSNLLSEFYIKKKKKR